ncbi:MAG TPA: hypothetical protein VIN59_09920 [Alphaproteobacteria bacterium]
MEHAIKHPKMESGGGLRTLAVLNLLVAFIAAPAMCLLGIMIASGNPAHETSLDVALFGALYAAITAIMAVKRAWKDDPNTRRTVFLMLGWLLAAAAFVITMIIIDSVTG